MLIKLTGTSTHGADSAEDPIGLLLACHERIRQHLALAQRVVDAVVPSASELSDSASSLIRYFGRALPLHHHDEQELLLPALRKHLLPSHVDDSLSVMSAEHAVIDPAIEDAIHLWRRLRDEPLQLSNLREELMQKTLLVSTLLLAHLEREERDIFDPATKILSEEEKRALTQQMRQRRQSTSG
ncbi:MAG: hemerythrin domain-containing protein [Polyangia bacterium]|jgi:hemerythrin-like domain-containing protein